MSQRFIPLPPKRPTREVDPLPPRSDGERKDLSLLSQYDQRPARYSFEGTSPQRDAFKILLTLTMSLSRVNDDNNVNDERSYVPDQLSSKARSIVMSSLPLDYKVLQLEYKGQGQVDVLLSPTKIRDRAEVLTDFGENYGETAADTWMEGDLMLNENEELIPKLHNLNFIDM